MLCRVYKDLGRQRELAFQDGNSFSRMGAGGEEVTLRYKTARDWIATLPYPSLQRISAIQPFLLNRRFD